MSLIYRKISWLDIGTQMSHKRSVERAHKSGSHCGHKEILAQHTTSKQTLNKPMIASRSMFPSVWMLVIEV